MIEVSVFVLEAFTSSVQHQAVTPYDRQRLKCNSPREIIMPPNAERFLIEQLASLAPRLSPAASRPALQGPLLGGVWPLLQPVQSTARSPKELTGIVQERADAKGRAKRYYLPTIIRNQVSPHLHTFTLFSF
jgi:hypothetical protein